MAHEFPLAVYAVWLKDHIFTDSSQRLIVFPKRADAVEWIDNNALFPKDLKIKKLTMDDPPPPYRATHPALDRAIKRLNKSSREYAKAQQRGELKIAAK